MGRSAVKTTDKTTTKPETVTTTRAKRQNNPEANRKRSMRSRTCVDCGKVDLVRADYKAERCAACSSRKTLKAVHLANPANPNARRCECGNLKSAKKYTRCSECRSARLSRTCKSCGCMFRVSPSTVNGKSNSAGNFCSRACYNRFLCDTAKETTMGPQWRKHKIEALKRSPFCAVCGTNQQLQVHHIVPRRKGGGSEQQNLIPLCVKHHRQIETMTCEAMMLGEDVDEVLMPVALRLRVRQVQTAKVIQRVGAHV